MKKVKETAQGTFYFEAKNEHAQYPTTHQVLAVRRGQDGDIVEFLLDDNTSVDYQTMIDMIHNGEVPALEAIENKAGELSIRSRVDGDDSNNLSNLPTF